jgi:hypothetical protein
MLSRFGEWIRPRTPEPPVPPRIGVDESGFSIDRPDGDRTLVLWASVCRVVTFKYDNWAVDEIMHPAFATNCRVLFTRERTGVPAG